MPPPTPYSARPDSPSTVTVRIATLNLAAGPRSGGASRPTAPQYTPRGESSRPAMICMLRTFGAPVTEPLGNSARKTSARPAPGASSEDTVDVSCHTVS